MKELSIEEKVKRYEQAFLRAKKLKETCDSNAVVGWMEYIFPELKESEDERIRKEIIVLVKDWWDRVNKDNISTKEQMIAWLEKHRHTDIALEDEYWRGYDDAKMNMEEKQGEQKHLHWLDELEGILQNATPAQLHDIQERYFNEAPVEWSEEDERKISWIIAMLQNSTMRDAVLSMTNDECIDWLKNLKDRVQPQNRWKPSDEQIEALDFAADCIVPAEFCFKRRVLKELLEQLKKLK